MAQLYQKQHQEKNILATRYQVKFSSTLNLNHFMKMLAMIKNFRVHVHLENNLKSTPYCLLLEIN